LSTQQSCGNALDEWKEARSVLARFDNNLHDLRKYGFSFVTALLAANGLISVGGTSTVTAEVKASILVVTMGLIFTLKLLDRHYLCFENAASLRCRILEDRLNLELTGDIAYFYKLEHWWANVLALYLVFIGLTAGLGIAIFWNQTLFLDAIIIAAVVFAVLIIVIELIKSASKDLQDWTVDLKIVSQGTPLRITYTNLNSKERKRPGTFTLWWTVKPLQVKNLKELTEERPMKVKLKFFENHVWLWETAQVEPGLYEFKMFSTRGTIGEIEAKTKDDNIDEATIQGLFEKEMSEKRNAPIKWIIQVTSAPKPSGPLSAILDALSHQ
jgi:hypothetical protein